jgi:hypothetical protein
MANILTIDQKKSQVKIKAFELDNQIVYEYFNKIPADLRDETFLKAIYIGTLALMEDRLSAFLSKTQNELSVELLSLKMIFDMKKEVFFKTAVKGMAAEDDIIQFLNGWFKEIGLKDIAEATGTLAGNIKGNKTGDVLCKVEGTDKSIVIEVKFDKAYKFGDIQDKDIFIKKSDTAWGQILEAKANRDSVVGMIVFDRSLVDTSITKEVSDVGFIRGVGFVAIVDSQKGDFKNLAIAYLLARDIVLNAKEFESSPEVLTIIVKRILNDLESLKSLEKHVKTIQNSSQSILDELNKGMLSIEFTLQYLNKFITDGKLTKEDLFNFYNAEDVKKKFSALNLELAE